MSNILIYDVAAESGGALTVLNNYYSKALKDTKNNYFFVISVVSYAESVNVHILNYPWVKKSWLHRLFMDDVFIQKIINNYQIDEVISLQNHAIKKCNKKQTVYVQNALPFCEYKFQIYNQPFLWVYQHVIGTMTVNSLRYANLIIVQTNWMKKSVSKQAGIEFEKIDVEPFETQMKGNINRKARTFKTFFYPATPTCYKNHQVIIDACKIINKLRTHDYQVVFTICGNENTTAKEIKKQIEKYNLPVKLVGNLSLEEVKDYYSSTCLLFPSYLETVGLPLKEAQVFGAPIIVADCQYSRETVGTYENVNYFNSFSAKELSDLMIGYIKN